MNIDTIRDLQILSTFVDKDINKINALLTPNFDVNMANKYGHGSILTLCLGIDKGIVKKILSYPNVDVNYVGSSGSSTILYEFSLNHNIIMTENFDKSIDQ
jgi:hypothetical protein